MPRFSNSSCNFLVRLIKPIIWAAVEAKNPMVNQASFILMVLKFQSLALTPTAVGVVTKVTKINSPICVGLFLVVIAKQMSCGVKP